MNKKINNSFGTFKLGTKIDVKFSRSINKNRFLNLFQLLEWLWLITLELNLMRFFQTKRLNKLSGSITQILPLILVYQ